MNNPIIITGTGRCGSSFVARVMSQEFDVFFGNIGGPTRIHPHGDYEDRIVRQLNIDLKRGARMPSSWRTVMLQIAQTRDEVHPRWGLKDPRFADHLDHVVGTFPDATYIWTERSREQVEASYKALGTFYRQNIQTFMEEYDRRMEALQEGLPEGYIHVDMTVEWDKDVLAEDLATRLGLDPADVQG